MLTSMIKDRITVTSSQHADVLVTIHNVQTLTCAEIMDAVQANITHRLNASLDCHHLWYTEQNSSEEVKFNPDQAFVKSLQDSTLEYAIRFETLGKLPHPHVPFADGQSDDNRQNQYYLEEARGRNSQQTEIIYQCLHTLNNRLALLERNNFTQT